MDKFRKKQENRKIRREEPKVIEGKDFPTGKKRGGKKACPGYVDHSKRRKVELTVPCSTCKRHFCSEECFETHKDLCQAKFYKSDTGDIQPLLEVCRKIYDTYIDKEGCVKAEWMKGDEKNRCGWFAYRVGWEHGDLGEAKKILKKHQPEYLRVRPGDSLRYL